MGIIKGILQCGNAPPSFLSGCLDSGNGGLGLGVTLQRSRGHLGGKLRISPPALDNPSQSASHHRPGQRGGGVAAPTDQRRPERHNRSSSSRRLYRPRTKTLAPLASVT